MVSFRFSGLLVSALAFASTAFDAFSDAVSCTASFCVNVLTGLWREVPTRVRNVLAKFSPMTHARPGVQIVRASAHLATFMHRSLSRREADYLRTM
jgi:hypothetical protein